MKPTLGLLGIFLGFLAAPPARADIDDPVGHGKSAENAAGLERWSVSLKSEFFGPSIGSPSTSRPNPLTGAPDPKTPIRAENALGLQYHWFDQISVGASLQADLVPVSGGGLTLKDPFAVIRDRRLVDQGALTMSGQFRIYPGVSRLSRSSHINGALRLVTDTIYRIPSTRLRFGLNAYYHQPWFEVMSMTARDRKFYIAPRAEYRFNPQLRAAVTFKNWISHRARTPFFDMRTDLTLLQLAAIWEASRNLVLIPSMDLNRVTSPSWNTTTVGATLAWQVL